MVEKENTEPAKIISLPPNDHPNSKVNYLRECPSEKLFPSFRSALWPLPIVTSLLDVKMVQSTSLPPMI